MDMTETTTTAAASTTTTLPNESLHNVRAQLMCALTTTTTAGATAMAESDCNSNCARWDHRTVLACESPPAGRPAPLCPAATNATSRSSPQAAPILLPSATRRQMPLPAPTWPEPQPQRYYVTARRQRRRGRGRQQRQQQRQQRQ